MFSSKDMTYGTPQNLFDKLDEEFHFTTDVCALSETAKCEDYYTPEIDGLKQDWNGVCWMNPPYGRDIGVWLEKAYIDSEKNDSTVVCLIPSRTDTKYWHDYCMKASEIRFIKGRLKFGEATNAAPFPSAIIIFKKQDAVHNLKVVPYIV